MFSTRTAKTRLMTRRRPTVTQEDLAAFHYEIARIGGVSR
jgi:hypothetical protein